MAARVLLVGAVGETDSGSIGEEKDDGLELGVIVGACRKRSAAGTGRPQVVEACGH